MHSFCVCCQVYRVPLCVYRVTDLRVVMAKETVFPLCNTLTVTVLVTEALDRAVVSNPPKVTLTNIRRDAAAMLAPLVTLRLTLLSTEIQIYTHNIKQSEFIYNKYLI